MTDGNKSGQESSMADAQWKEFSELLPERTDVKVPEDDEFNSIGGESSGGDDDSGTLSQRMKSSPKLSDAQTFDLRLFPAMKKEWLEILQVSRVFPDTYNHLFRIFVKDLMREDRKLTLAQAIAYVHTSLSIAIDGEGRIDELALSGATSNKADEDKSRGII
jgi:hypothetical protein